MSIDAIINLLFLLNIALFPAISALNQEGHVLLSWLSTFNSSSSAHFSSWNTTHETPCEWDHIVCSGNGFVSEIRISSINLHTSFPTQLLSFSSLTTLEIVDGNLTGEIPPSIANLSTLVTLNLSFNSLSGKIPKEIGRLSELQILALSSNSFYGAIPSEIGNCSKLKELELFDNQFSGKIPAEMGELISLEIFRAGGNSGIYGQIPMQISNCKSLVFLGLADTGISGQIPSSIGELKNLRTLSLYTTNLTGEIPPQIGNCSALENLFMYENEISGKIPAELGLLRNLHSLLLWQNNLRGSIPEDLGNCSGLSVIDFSLNSLVGKLPQSFANLCKLEGLLLSDNFISGKIPTFIGNFTIMKQLELDNNRFSGEVPSSIGKVRELSLFFAWQNQLTGSIPIELGNCEKLQAVDLSHNFLMGPIPDTLFNLQYLTELLLISNGLSGKLPSNIGSCTNLIRLRLGSNKLTGPIPSAIGLLHSLEFLELSENQLTGEIPLEVGNCTQLQLLDLHGNKLQGGIPFSVKFLQKLNVLVISRNRISGTIPQNFGRLTSLNKLILSENEITGFIPRSLGLCKDLQLLEMSSNKISGSIPEEIGHLQGLDILLNLSWNYLVGPIPDSFTNLSNLANLDLSHNMLSGTLKILGNLNNLVSLDISYNMFSGSVPDTKLFQNLPPKALSGNQDLCIEGKKCQTKKNLHGENLARNFTFCILLSLAITIITIVGVILLLRTHGDALRKHNEEDGLEWDFTPFQKLNFSINEIVPKLSDSNIVGKGCSGVVYRVETPMRQVIAVKKLWPIKNEEPPERDWFSAEVETLGSIRHKNIVRLLGCCNNGKSRLLLFDYVSNGNLATLLHEKELLTDWDSRYKILLGAARGLAYLHHDCFPPIVHRDIKANNILIGPHFEALLADFGLAKLVESGECSRASNTVAGSYGYIAPEYGYSLRITEKSDVYSFGVVMLEVFTGMEPMDQRILDGSHIVKWVHQELKEKHGDITSVLDKQLLLSSSTQLQEMHQVLGVATLCVNINPDERPSMKDVSAMLEEIRNEKDDSEKPSFLGKGTSNPRAEVHCSSFSRSSEHLMSSSSLLVLAVYQLGVTHLLNEKTEERTTGKKGKKKKNLSKVEQQQEMRDYQQSRIRLKIVQVPYLPSKRLW
ncbi:Leucine-rich repeat [Dillenia turbinata]|uniref:Leucine-rich repeat n=1 Tax=Dillenia turbinata TaxID=194707 RepID=A0AAN8ZHL8_9MAGN